MKLFLKVLKISVLVLFLSIISLALAGWLLQDRITNYALSELSNTFDAPLGTNKVSFSLISDFPLASIQFEGLWLGAYKWDNDKEIKGIDTLVSLNNLFVSVNTKDLLSEKFTIRKVELQDGFAKYEVDENGVSNFDFLMSSDSTTVEEVVEEEAEPVDLTAEGISLTNLTLIYKDDAQQIKAKVYIPEINGAVKLKDPKTFAHFIGNLHVTDLYIQDTQLDRMQKAEINMDLTLKADTLLIESLALQTEETSLTTNGKLIMADQMFADLNSTFSTPNLAALMKYVPDDLLNSYDISQVSGELDLKSKVTGIIGEEYLPHYEATLNLSKGSLKYQDYPLVYNIGLQTEATNGSKNNNATTAVNLKQLIADFSGNHIDLKGNFSNLDKLKYSINSKLDLDLDASKPMIPDSLAQDIGGNISLQIATSGVASDSIDDVFIAQAMKNTKAQINFDQFKIKIDDLINLKQLSAQIGFADNNINLQALNAFLPDYQVRLIDNRLKLEISGDILKPETTTIKIPSFHLATTEGSIDGSAIVRELKYLNFAMNSQLHLNLKELKRFASDTLANDMSGLIAASIQSKGKLNLDKMTDAEIETILYDNSNFDLSLKNINLDMTDTLMNVKNLNGRIVKNNHKISINDFKGIYQDMSFNIESTTIDNPFNTALRNQPGTLKVNGVYRFGDMDYKVLGAFAGSDESDTEVKEPEIEPVSEPTVWNYEITGQVFAKSFKYDDILIKGIETTYDINDANKLIKGQIKLDQTTYDQTVVNKVATRFEMNMSNNEIKGKLTVNDVKHEDALLDNISALYNVKDTVYTVDQMKVNGFGGTTNSSFKVHVKEKDKMEIEMKTTVADLDIRRLMKEMKNFDQEEMTYEQLNGVVSSDNLFLKMTMIGDSLIYPELMMTCDLTFKDGGIYQYHAVQDMAEYLPKVDNLDTMSFKTIDTHMFIFNDAVYVPRTYVVTSEFDVEAIGKQSFGEDYQYHVGVNLKEILKGKKGNKIEANKPIEKKKMVRLVATTTKTGFDKVKDREKMEIVIFTKERSLKLAFHPKWFNFETGVQ